MRLNLNIDELEYQINRMRKNLILIALETGIDSDDTLSYSQKLDKLIAQYQKIQLETINTDSKQAYDNNGLASSHES
ncbi:Spo0E family sporulation regulatory protein-aspartic acid phosphatase [Niallia sp. Krafla_26]|uniref:Spo0E family sporulation regulatory protein-aspartic acid phosphatase n=1 Tax=Niallia sp. Krafla_26 TaxID=3064703 RepID=UPI003D185BCE